ncbi:MAG: methanol dehydrogenase [Alphaproteobacteria bacterium HGW-Alphaproteobacteria-16]|nr:MAG: methanol dehydrogenase [Alphaproteobacteria bacterium HGW-Alphaproteobacteria-16]
MRRMHLFFALMLAVLVGTAAQAQTFPALTGRVVDAASLLSPEQVAQITAMSEATEQATGRQLVVATVPDLQGYPIEDFGYRLGREWQIGQAEANNGIILLVAPKERKVRIEVGYGLEPIVTDALSQQIIDTEILPAFRKGDMGAGIVAGASSVNEQLKLPLEAAEARAKQLLDAGKGRKKGGAPGWFVLIFWIFILLFFVLPIIFGASRGRKYRGGSAPVVIWGPGWGGGSGGSSWGGGGSSWGGGGGGFGGGGFGGGGGSFGGGGASGGW